MCIRDSFLTSLGPLTKAAETGLPSIKTTLDLTVPVLENLRPVLHNLDPFLQYTGEYVPEVQAFFANLTAASQAQGSNGSLVAREGPKQHLLTTMAVLSPQSLAIYSGRIGTNRGNPYQQPGALLSLPSGLPVFSNSNCANSAPSVNPKGPESEAISKEILEQLIAFKVVNEPATPNKVAAPPCNQQGPFTFNGQSSQFPHVIYSNPTPSK